MYSPIVHLSKNRPTVNRSDPDSRRDVIKKREEALLQQERQKDVISSFAELVQLYSRHIPSLVLKKLNIQNIFLYSYYRPTLFRCRNYCRDRFCADSTSLETKNWVDTQWAKVDFTCIISMKFSKWSEFESLLEALANDFQINEETDFYLCCIKQAI